MATAELEIRADASQAKEEVRSLRTEVENLRAELERARSPRISISREPLTYEAQLVRDPSGHRGFTALSTRGNYSYVRDLVRLQRDGDQGALSRLQRHAKEMRIVGEEREKRFATGASYEYEERAVSWTSGAGGYFAPPLWIVEQFAIQPTPERVLSKMAPKFALPEGAQSVNVPRFTTGPDTGPSSVGGAPGAGGDVDTVVSSAVATIAGNFDVPLQMLEQSPVGAHLDWVAFETMEARYGADLETQLITGAGTNVEATRTGNNQLLGILNNTSIPSSNVISYPTASPTVADMIELASGGVGAIPKAVAAIGNNRKLPPEIWMMTTSRAAWISSGDLGMPLALANQIGPGAFDMLAYRVYENDTIPTTLGAAANQDTIIACRPSDWLILESEPRTQVMLDALSGALQARLQSRRYVAALLRQPTSVAYLSGVGMIPVSGF